MQTELAVMLSIHHEHAERIFSELKTLEIRKTAPQNVTFPYIIYICMKQKAPGAVVL